MLEKLRESIEKRLMEKGVSLIMLFDGNGHIKWHSGRKIRGNGVRKGNGFSKTACVKALDNKAMVEFKDDVIKLSGDGLSETAISIKIKSIIILPIDKGNYFYVDSAKKEFSREDMISIRESCYYLKECIRESEKYYEEILSEIKIIDDISKKKILRYGAEAKTPILLTGETGVGKGYISKIIHEVSQRGGKYVNINAAAMPETLLESELFGYKKGAFTGAKVDKAGLIEEAEGGTLFLDEIGDMGFDSQTKILKVIEEGKYMRLGDSKERSCDVRFVFSTNRDLIKLVEEKRFRKDLYYRISEFWIDIPPLRKRRDMIDKLIEGYEELLNGKRFTKKAMEFIKIYDWRGNIRELKSMMKRVGVMTEGDKIGIKEVIESVENHLNKEEIRELIERMGLKDNCCDVYERVKFTVTGENKTNKNPKVKAIIDEIEKGKSFWEAVKKPFMRRELNREEVKEVIDFALLKTDTKRYKECLQYLNISNDEHKKFLDFLKDYRIK